MSADLYFKVIPSSPVMVVIERIKVDMQKRNDALDAFRKRHSLKEDRPLWGNSRFVLGVGGPPIEGESGWRWDRKGRFNCPDKKTPEGKALAKELSDIPYDTDWQSISCEIFDHDLLCGMDESGRGMCTRFAVFGWTERGVVCRMHASVKKGAGKWPDGLVEITGSECESIMNSMEAA